MLFFIVRCLICQFSIINLKSMERFAAIDFETAPSWSTTSCRLSLPIAGMT